MPRINSTRLMTGTGFMKGMPMNFAGRSVADANRVIEIDDVLLGMDAPDRRLLVLLPNLPAADLARQAVKNRLGHPPQCLFMDIGQHDLEAGQRANMRDAAPHLAGADDADAADVAHCWRFPSSSSSSGNTLNRSPTRP